MNLTAAVVIAAAALAGPPAKETTAPAGYKQVPYCLISSLDSVKISARTAGPIVAVNVREGAAINPGDVLAQIDDRDMQIKRKVAHYEAEVAREQGTDVNVRNAEKIAKVAEAEYEQSLEINRRKPGTISETEVRRQRVQHESSVLKIEVAEVEMRVAKLSHSIKEAAVEATDYEIQQRKIESPIAGVVDHILIRAGEWVQPGQPVMELVRVDKLRVEAFLNAYEISPRDVEGRPVIIEVPVGGGKTEKFESKIGFVSPVVVADGAYRVWVEFDNKKVNDYWLVRPGLTATMLIKVDGATAPVSAPLVPANNRR